MSCKLTLYSTFALDPLSLPYDDCRKPKPANDAGQNKQESNFCGNHCTLWIAVNAILGPLELCSKFHRKVGKKSDWICQIGILSMTVWPWSKENVLGAFRLGDCARSEPNETLPSIFPPNTERNRHLGNPVRPGKTVLKIFEFDYALLLAL